MSEVIHSTYEIIEKIGSGGGGIVYLANHLNLGKKIVLKADKRKITTRPELLRREVDVLKNLSHTYIPQVYDYFIENGIVYTAIDYIDGESLDKPLDRGEKFSQSRVIKWAKQLLEALQYLHEPRHGDPPKGYVHSDIKPANLMLTSDDTICLIDFNIALALGEENVLGLSAGYASPEHYGIDYSVTESEETVKIDTIIDAAQTVKLSDMSGSESNAANIKQKKMPDVRSDIYMVGATLYHLLSGNRPAKNAKEVVPLSDKMFNAQIVGIITKAMQPDPDRRYQTAAEMLYAFEHLRDNDPRVIRCKAQKKICIAVLSAAMISGAFSAFTGLKRIQTSERWQNLANHSREALRQGDSDSAVQYAMQAISLKSGIFTPDNIADAQLALTDALGVYDLSDGYKVYKTFELPSEPLYMKLSPDGKTVLCIYAYELAIIDTETCSVLDTLPVADSALSEAKFLDNDNIIFAGQNGITKYNIPAHSVIWSGNAATSIALSADGQRAAAVYKDESYAAVYNIQDGSKICTVDFEGRKQRVTVNDSFANPDDNLLALNEDGTMLGISFDDESVRLYDLLMPDNEAELLGPGSGYTHFEGGFYHDYFSFSASSANDSIFAVIDTNTMEQTGGFQSSSAFSVYADNDGIRLQNDDILVKIDPVTGEQIPLVTTSEPIWRFADDGIHTIIASKTNFMFYDRNAIELSSYKSNVRSDFLEIAGDAAIVGSMDSSRVQILRFEEHEEADLFEYDISDSHSETRVSADSETVVMFSYNKFRIYDKNGEKLAEVDIPDAEQINDQQFVRESNNSYLEVIYNDGKRLDYDSQSGKIIAEYQGEPPDKTLYEELETERYRIKNPLHGTPEVYDAKNGKLLCRLQEDAYLTYVTQIGDRLVVQYITANGYYYGQLLNEKCEVIAQLPYLCDVIDEKLVFDYPTGKVRISPVYNLNQLVEIAEILKGVKNNEI